VSTTGVCEEAATRRDCDADRVRRRHVIYVEGYDYRGAEGYFDLFRRSCDAFRRARPVGLTLHPLALDSDDFAHWALDLRVSRQKVAVQYDFLRMERFVRADIAHSTAWHLWRSLRWIAGDLASGALFRIFRASWRFGLHLVSFQLLVLAWLAVAVTVALTAAWALRHAVGWTLPAAILWAVVAAWLCVLALRPMADRLYGTHIPACWATLRSFGRGRPTWVDHVVTVCARHLVAVAHAGTTDELVLVGHSTGGAIGLAVIARALEIDPDLCARGPEVVLLTLGSVMPAVALDPFARRMRDDVRRAVAEPRLTWIDCQSRKDIMNFPNFDPVAGIGVKPRHCGLVVWPIRFRDMVSPERYGRFRWNFFKLHYQYVMAGDRPAPYDYVLLIGGPRSVAAVAKHRGDVATAVDGNGAAAHREQ